MCDHIRSYIQWWRWAGTLWFLCRYWASKYSWGIEGLKVDISHDGETEIHRGQ